MKSADELAVERDALLQGGRTPEEVEAMQAAVENTSTEWAAQEFSKPAHEDGEGACIDAGKRLAVYRHWDDWWVGTSPRNGHGASVEGPWEDWVSLAQGILAIEAQRRLSIRESAGGASAPRAEGGR